ncbi:hypothetical protein like AT3G23880 [Hibiscus trionum]|uniref:F-box domain-containing protein n=1 Tax=Hibiscus trionum TaxID=183268 RepID=A0A9W7IL79_HIBTR|nr:hypothetical protein like AT3G23880 [Hibiscus trionum]
MLSPVCDSDSTTKCREMENQNQESFPSQPNQQLSSPTHELPPNSSNEQTQKRNGTESPQHESHDVPVQPPKSSRNANLPPPSFPQEIVVEILSYLPVKSLLRFTCVSKSWKTLKSDPFFIKKHLKTDPNFSKKRVLIDSGSAQIRGIISCSLKAIFDDPIVTNTTYDDLSYEWFVGSCNGLICIAIKQDGVILVNPTLRVCKMLPDFGFKKSWNWDCYTVYGFGFDASVDDYKVVRIRCYPNKAFEDGYESVVEVFSLRTNCWRMILEFPFRIPFRTAGKHVNGSLNWPVFRGQDEFSHTIISLDLAEETCKEVPQPCYGDGASERSLGVLDGCLCVLCNYERLYADVWVMKEYGKRESWTKLVTITYMGVPVYRDNHEYFAAPLFVSRTGEILLQFGMKLILYNPKWEEFRTPAFRTLSEAFYFINRAVVYEESLVSPTGVNQPS